jgi:hypothetical protein
MRPAVRGVAELVDQALLGAAALVLVLERQLRVLDHRLEPRVSRQADQVVHARALAPVDQALAAKARVASQRAAAAVNPILRSAADSSITPASLVMLPPSKRRCT